MRHALPFTDEKNTSLGRMLLDVPLRWPRVLTLLLLTVFLSLSFIFSSGSPPSLHITGETILRTRRVQFDNYSLILNGQRVFLQYATESSFLNTSLTTFQLRRVPYFSSSRSFTMAGHPSKGQGCWPQRTQHLYTHGYHEPVSRYRRL